jgi:hypothetical protein
VNKALLVIIVVIVIIVVVAIIFGIKTDSCTLSGGIVSTANCCKSVNDFPNNCVIGACGCSLNNSHEIKICNCPEGKCFDGNKCVEVENPKVVFPD